MELLIFVILAGVIGYFFGKSRRPKTSPPASEQVVDVEVKEKPKAEKPTSE